MNIQRSPSGADDPFLLDSPPGEAVAANAEFFSRLVEHFPDAVLATSEGRIVYCNEAAVRFFGAASADQLLQSSFRDHVSASGLETLMSMLARRNGQPTVPSDIQLRRLDGTTIEAELRASAIGDSSMTQVILRDVSERRRADTAIRENEERLRLAFTGAQEGVWDWDLETGAVVYSKRWKEMLGYADEEIEPHVSAWERLIHPEDSARARSVVHQLARGESTYRVECRLRHKKGHYIHVLSRGYPVRRESDGKVVRIVGTHLDLTERRRAEDALRESEERLKLAFAGAQEGVWDWNLETGAVVYSHRWKEMLGYEDHEIEPDVSAWERLLHPDDRLRAHQVNMSVIDGSPSYEMEVRLRHKDGHYVHVLSRGLPIRRNTDGTVIRIVGTHFDLSERKRAEEELLRAHEQLEHRVRERTAELARANVSLQIEMREREVAERARTELLGRLVFAQEDERRRIAREMHDQFGEHLTSLSRRIEGLKRAVASDSPLAHEVDALDTVAQRLDRDVDHLVWELRPTALDDLGLRAALSNYVKDWSARVHIAAQLHTSGLQEHRLPSEVETTLYRIAQEALTNVARHSGATTVDIVLERRPDAVVLVVEDNGSGFDLEAARTQGRFGLLGMQERALLVGATLQIESAPGHGATVLLRLTEPSPPGAAHD
jgi:PAS domain S-box-containing protein